MIDRDQHSLQVRRVTDPDDAALGDLMDIYQASFPPDEQVRFSWWLELFRAMRTGSLEHRHLLAVEQTSQQPTEVVGMAYYELESVAVASGTAAFLWYIATRADLRGRGLGAEVYQSILTSVATRGCCAMVFEVEMPSVAARESAERGTIAERRIRWYERNGARVVEGIHYVQTVGWQPPLEMHLMVHPCAPFSDQELLPLLQGIAGDNMQVKSEVRLRAVTA